MVSQQKNDQDERLVSVSVLFEPQRPDAQGCVWNMRIPVSAYQRDELEAEATRMGLDLSDAVRLLLREAVRTRNAERDWSRHLAAKHLRELADTIWSAR